MLLKIILFFGIATALTTGLVALVRVISARFWLGLPLTVLVLGATAAVSTILGLDQGIAEVLAVIAFAITVAIRIAQPRWSFLGAQVMGTLTVACLAYLLYAWYLTVWLLLNYGVVWFLASFLLLLVEFLALFFAISYAFEIVDVLSRRVIDEPPPPLTAMPAVAIQVPTYAEPVEVVRPTLEALAAIDYPNYLVQVVDNNTRDPELWRPLQQMCEALGPRFEFMHLQDWPGYKAGALNEATRRLPANVELIAVVDADYVVRPSFLKALIPYFDDLRVAFVQCPQDYRDWADEPYLRALYNSYKYFFDLTMRARAHRNAIIFCGTMGILRRSAWKEIGGWSETCVTEDAEASLRTIGRGYRATYHPEAQGSGLMPLSFDGLKKQRYRWALGGVQILREHWRELIPLAPHRLKLTMGQRLHYLLGSLQWFGDVLAAGFTLILTFTAVGIAINHRLPIRQLTGPLIVVPVLFLLSGLMRAVWALRDTERCSWGDALRAMRVWFALSWVVTLACVNGLLRKRAVFLRTPKHKEGQARLSEALASARMETAIAAAAVAAAFWMVVVTRSPAFLILGAMLLFDAFIYLNAPWASLAAEGIKLTPLREAYRSSPQSTGDRPGLGGRRALAFTSLTALAGALFAAAAAGLFTATPTRPNAPVPDVLGGQPSSPVPSPSASATPQSPTSAPTPVASPTPEPTPTASQAAGPTVTP